MSAARITTFLLLSLLVLGGVNTYVHRRAASVLGLSRRGRRALAGGLAAVVLTMFAARLVETYGPASLARILIFTTWNVELALVVSTAALLVLDLARAVARGVGQAQRARRLGLAAQNAEADPVAAPSGRSSAPVEARAPAAVDGPMIENRRDFLHRAAVGGALLAGTSAVGYGALFGRHDYVVEEVAIRIPGLSPRLDGLAIVQLSDLHVGLFVGEPEVRSALALVQRARPDLIVLTGDLVDHDLRYTPLLGDFVARLSVLARFGVSVIPGNHDYYTGIDAVLAAATRGGASVLRNANRMIGDAGGRFALIGVDDVHGKASGQSGGPDLARASAGLSGDEPRILLCHNPVFFPDAAGKVALQLSGHTHGGQVNPLVRPADLVLPYGYVAGRYERGGSTLYVNRGFGTAGPPARIGSPPEVTRIVLVAA